MSLLGDLEQQVIDQLATGITELRVEPYPVNPNHYRLYNPRGAVLVMVANSRFLVTRAGVQERSTRVVVTLLLRQLTDHHQTYDFMETVQMLLLGYQPEGWQPITAVSEQIVSKDPSEGVWQVDMVFETRCLAVSQFDLCPLST